MITLPNTNSGRRSNSRAVSRRAVLRAVSATADADMAGPAGTVI